MDIVQAYEYIQNNVVCKVWAYFCVVQYIEITSWKVRAYGFYSRVVKYHKTNERGFASE